ncbi:hypothetical protein GMB80_04145 [Turicibacter sanguinis]|uniref:hypothetical protein n=1 Tax=Turicibacter sanguinis TaxID=154288 RepID=UPI0012BCEEEC|nr:hypothetical protein [Turicibacter sanguinis]MDB8563742.1 hypothetical protein [Turicibacter sanguinis]MTP72125.1 hypothetical protein [Turicibacter sanguinis]
MQLNDWLMLTSIACVIVATISAVYLLSRLRQAINTQTEQIKTCNQKMKEVPSELKREMNTTVQEFKQKIKMGWKIVAFIRRRRQKRKLKRLQKQGLRG